MTPLHGVLVGAVCVAVAMWAGWNRGYRKGFRAGAACMLDEWKALHASDALSAREQTATRVIGLTVESPTASAR